MGWQHHDRDGTLILPAPYEQKCLGHTQYYHHAISITVPESQCVRTRRKAYGATRTCRSEAKRVRGVNALIFSAYPCWSWPIDRLRRSLAGQVAAVWCAAAYNPAACYYGRARTDFRERFAISPLLDGLWSAR